MASALVQMTPFSPSQMSDILMVASENSLESFPESRDESGTKRPGTFDGDDYQDRSHVKKRRKQSKPIRITAVNPPTDPQQTGDQNVQGTSDLDFSETGEHFLSDRLATSNAVNLIPSEEYENFKRVNQDQSKVQNDNQNTTALSENVHSSPVPLNLSNMKSSFIDSLIVPNVRDSQTTNEKPVPVDNSLHHFQSTENNSKTSAQENAYLSQSPTSLILPLFKQNQIQNQISQISSQMRIFNPEAFCDLCNKEFCNKYFLKTHKANKHGIYSENQSGPPLLEQMPSIPFTNYFSSNSETYDNSQLFQTTSSAKNLNVYNQANSVYPSSRSTPKKTQVIPPQPQSSLFSLKSNSSGNMRALCNICQREFCNKYFVRRHKQKIHGIVDPISKDGSAIDFQENYNYNNSSQDKLDGSVSEGEIYTSYVKQLLPSNFSLDMRDSLQTPEIKVEKFKETQDKGVDRESQVTQNSLDVSSPYETNTIFQQSQNEENNKENSLTDIKLKKLGIVNADAFCDICCKEYCNKYFLRTHKLKSHGIITIDDRKDDITNGTSNMSWFQTQTMPLNLIVNDGLSSNRDGTDKVYLDTEADECVCGVCGRYFQNQLLLKMHEVQSHANSYANSENILPVVQQPPKIDTNKAMAVTDDDKTQKQTDSYFPVIVKKECSKDSVDDDIKLTIHEENVKKLQILISRLNNSSLTENSVCDVCEKDVGHVSLLENHILKEHAELLEELGSIAEEENSSSQSSVVLTSSSFKKECTLCQKIFFKPSAFEHHMKEIHGDTEFVIESDNIKGPLDQKDINPLKMFGFQSSDGVQTPTSSFCEICKKELCNKYFMKTHMQRMHGISIENGAQIGGVVCDICNKELCSKYFLRVHKQNSHGIVDELFLPQLGLDLARNQSPLADPALKPTDQADLNHRYFTHFNEVCNICNRRFRSLKWLRAHLWNDHGEEGKEKYKELSLSSTVDLKTNLFDENYKESSKNVELHTYGIPTNPSNNYNTVENQNGKDGKSSGDKQCFPEKSSLNNSTFSLLINGGDSETKQYQCSYCSFTTTILAFLFIHERSHLTTNFQYTSENSNQCPICYQTIESKEHFEKHLKLHNTSWQQSYSLNNSAQDFLKSQDRKCSVKNDIIISKTADSVGLTQQDQATHGNVNSVYSQDVSQNAAQNNQPEPSSDLTMQCTRCKVRCTNVQEYLEHLNKEHPYHQMDQELPSYLQQMENALSTLACNAGIPAAFAVPQMQDKVTMQPFVLEDSEYSSDTNNSITKKGKTFLSSLVFLPVKEKLKKSVTASFKLTPT